MSPNPEDVRADIERTRAALGRDVDAIAEKTDPAKVVDRQAEKVRGKWTHMRESVMGSTDGLTSRDSSKSAHDPVRSTDQLVEATEQKLKQRTRGNPLAAGLIALGAGWLIGSLLPASEPEQELATTAKKKAEPAIEEAKSIAQDIGEELQPSVDEAVESVTDTARDGAQNIRETGQREFSDIQDEAQQAVKNVRDSAQDR